MNVAAFQRTEEKFKPICRALELYYLQVMGNPSMSLLIERPSSFNGRTCWPAGDEDQEEEDDDSREEEAEVYPGEKGPERSLSWRPPV